MEFVSYFNRNTVNHIGTQNDEESMTDQSFKYDSDINVMVDKYMHGIAPRTPVREPVYNENNYETANWTFEDWQNQKAMIERKFLHLSPDLQAKFVTPANFFKYCSNPENYIVTENGIADKQTVETPQIIPEVQNSTPAAENK